MSGIMSILSQNLIKFLRCFEKKITFMSCSLEYDMMTENTWLRAENFNSALKWSSYWCNFHHCLHWKLSKWQLSVQPMIKILSKWLYFHFSVVMIFTTKDHCSETNHNQMPCHQWKSHYHKTLSYGQFPWSWPIACVKCVIVRDQRALICDWSQEWGPTRGSTGSHYRQWCQQRRYNSSRLDFQGTSRGTWI